MVDLTTKYLGITLTNPIIIGSSGLTDSTEKIKELEKNGAGAVVLKSLFEEEILLEAEYKYMKAKEDSIMYAQFSETMDYIDLHIKNNRVSDYIALIKDLKREILIPVIASINCVTSQEWPAFAKQIEAAGADALELNVFTMPSDFERSSQDIENLYFDIVKKIKSLIQIPVAIKLSPYFTGLGHMLQKLSASGVDGMVLFNRFYSPDFDINKLEVHEANKFSTPEELANTLRWIAIMSRRVKCDLAASTGIHDGKALIKQLLAGANAVQISSVIYKKGAGHISIMLEELQKWMESKQYNYIDQFRGKLSQNASQNPSVFERMQFMKYFSEIQ
jgi:dihydroorotate dehydrogenase (fumarate)